MAKDKEHKRTVEPSLVRTPEGLALQREELILYGDFSRMKRRITPHCLQKEQVVRAIKGRAKETGLLVTDATGGLGEDAFLLAAAGCRVTVLEYDPIIFALLRDAWERGKSDPDIAEILQRMELKNEDAIETLPQFLPVPDVVYLDPMFPKRKKSGAIKKKFQLLQQLEMPCVDEEALFLAAEAAHPKKIVVKRPQNSSFFAGRKPKYSLQGSSIRFDCYMLDKVLL